MKILFFFLFFSVSMNAQRWICPPRLDYDYIGMFADNGLAPMGQDSLYGYLDTSGRVRIPPRYRRAYPFLGRYALVFIQDRQGGAGVIDETGREVIPPHRDFGNIDMAYFDHFGWTVVDSVLEWAQDPEMGEAFMYPLESDHLLIDREGRCLYRSRYMIQLTEHHAIVQVEDSVSVRYALLDRRGKSAYEGLSLASIEGDFLYFRRQDDVYEYEIFDRSGRLVPGGPFDAVERWNDSMFIVSKAGLYGCLRSDGTWLVEPNYALYQMDEYQGLLRLQDAQGDAYLYDISPLAPMLQHRVPAQANREDELPTRLDGHYYYRFSSNNKAGICDETGKITVPAMYSYCELYPPHHALFLRDEMQGILDVRDGRVLLELPALRNPRRRKNEPYDPVLATKYRISLALGMWDSPDASTFENLFSQQVMSVLIQQKKAQRTGLIGLDGNWRIEPQAGELLCEHPGLLQHRYRERYALLNLQGKRLHEEPFEYLERAGEMDIYWARYTQSPSEKEDELPSSFAIFDSTGKQLQEHVDNVDFVEGLLCLYRYDAQRVLVDTAGNYWPIYNYDSLYPFSDGRALVREGDRYGFLNTRGEVAIELQYSDARPFEQGQAVVRTDQGWGLVDTLGNWLVAAGKHGEPAAWTPSLDSSNYRPIVVTSPFASPSAWFSEGYAWARIPLYGMIQANGKPLLNPLLSAHGFLYPANFDAYSYSSPMYPGFFAVCYKGKWGVLRW